MDNVDWLESPRPGFRLKKLELTNWGTFDSSKGEVYKLSLDGRSALLVGQNGSGKSTLVDALLTLLVQPGVRNYNVAAGAKKRERDERTYIRGACGRSSDQELGSVTDYLRPGDKYYSVLLACFQREETSAAFTVAQVLQITADGEVDKTYAFAEGERSIAGDLSGLQRGKRIRSQLIERGFKATSRYTEYLPWITQLTHMRAKAMDIFNQTVAVKDIQSLNRFIREHMLEAHPWRERIEGLLAHFTQLSLAHLALVKARRQVELLQPIEAAAGELARLSEELNVCQQQLDAVDSFFRQQTILWLQPRLTLNSGSLLRAQRFKQDLQKEIDALDETQRLLKNEIEKAGGERLRQLPLLLETQYALLNAKQRERRRLQAALGLLEATLSLENRQGSLENRQGFDLLPEKLECIREQLATESSQLAEQRLILAGRLTDVRTAIGEEQVQFDVLHQQTGNLPSWLSDIRSAMAGDLGLDKSELMFVCELISIREEELAWQPAIELVLRRFALSLLVPEKFYHEVSHYVQVHRMVDATGRGQRLVYLRVPTRQPDQQIDRTQADSLVYKLRLRREHPRADWLLAELHSRFDYRCCDTLEQFQRAPGLAVTRERHVKFGMRQHEKDDRPQTVDSRHFVLGWDNARRLNEVQQSLQTLGERQAEIVQSLQCLEIESKKMSKRLSAVDAALSVPDFDLIDITRHETEIAKLEDEREAIESSNDAVRGLRKRLDEAIERRFAAQGERDAQVASEGNLLRETDWARQALARHERVLAARAEDGSLAEHEKVFETLEANLADRLAGLSEFGQFAEVQQECSRQIQSRLNALRQQADPLRADVVRSMQRFLSDNPEERNDLRADMLYIDGFLGLLQQLREDDLPRHEQRFRERLNEKVVQEIGVLHAALQCERQEIVSKVGLLNDSLEQLEYRAGTFMRLDPRAVKDREICEFQCLLRDCLSEKLDGPECTDEARYLRIESLIHRLREEERWRDKVTDVRRWFDFSARELDLISGEERGCYEDSAGQSGGEKAKLAFTILVAAIAYQFNIDLHCSAEDRFHFVVVDEMFSKVDDRYAEYALQLFEKFGLQLLIVAPLDAKARVTEPYVGCYHHTVKNESQRTSQVFSLTALEYEQALGRERLSSVNSGVSDDAVLAPTKPR